MRVLFIFVVFQCFHEAFFQSCIYTNTDYVCKQIPTDYPAGLTSVIIFVSGLGEISLSMFNSTNLTSVSSLTMAYQGVTAIAPQTFEKFQNLKSLNLDNNDLSRVTSDWFCHPNALEMLKLSNNKITTLDHNSLDGLSNLVMFNLSQNQVDTMAKSSFLGLSKLRQLDLSNNKLVHLNVDVFLPLNGTKIRLDGNPWDCSCSVEDLTKYLRGLKNASLLENEILVCCSSPPELQGVPVWQVPECKALTTMSATSLSLPTGSPATGSPAPILIIKPLAIGHSTLIILIVVLCALVFVICVLSVLYHRKRERKHLQAVKPSFEKSETIHTSETTTKSNGKDDRKMQSGTANKTQIATTEVLLRTNQMVDGDEKISQIYHIYSSGTFEASDPIKRVRSAGPVLCRTDMFAELTEAEVVAEGNGMRNDEYYNGWMTSEKDNESMNIEKMEKLEDRNKIAAKENEGFTELSGALESHEESCRETNEDTNGRPKAGTRVDKDVPQWGLENDVLDHMKFTLDVGSSQDVLEVKEVTSEADELEENLPYLIIGADPEKQIPEVDPNTAKATSEQLRPIRRVLTWPPTAVQWKKQWAKNQQVLNVFPNLIFVTGCRHEIGPFCLSVPPATLPTAPQFSALEILPEIMSPDVRVAIDEDAYRASLESCTQKGLHFSPLEDFSNANISLREDCRVLTNEETWRPGFESTIGLSSKNSPLDESEVCSELFSIFNPSFGETKSKPAVGEEVINEDNVEEIQSVRKKTNQVSSALQKQSRKVEKEAHRAHRSRRRGQVCNGSASRVPPSGGSPKDDSLLLGNEYTFIDLLHEVVENHGRWTRDRWRQTQKNKHKLKQSR